MIVGLALILLAQLSGEIAGRATGLPVPGPVIGMAFLLAFFVLRDSLRDRSARLIPQPLRDGTLENTGKGLLAHLSLMFIPAGVGIIGRLDTLALHGAALAFVITVSVVATLTATALTFVGVSRLVNRSSDCASPKHRR